MPSLKIDSDPENVIQSKYYDIGRLKQLKIPNKEKSLSLFHINSCSVNKIFEELQDLLQSKNIHFDVIAIAETQIPKFINSKYCIERIIPLKTLLQNFLWEVHIYM